jgi:hypothetical protein
MEGRSIKAEMLRIYGNEFQFLDLQLVADREESSSVSARIGYRNATRNADISALCLEPPVRNLQIPQTSWAAI